MINHQHWDKKKGTRVGRLPQCFVSLGDTNFQPRGLRHTYMFVHRHRHTLLPSPQECLFLPLLYLALSCFRTKLAKNHTTFSLLSISRYNLL